MQALQCAVFLHIAYWLEYCLRMFLRVQFGGGAGPERKGYISLVPRSLGTRRWHKDVGTARHDIGKC